MIWLRWKAWEIAMWTAYWLCPDKHVLTHIYQHGTAKTREALGMPKKEST